MIEKHEWTFTLVVILRPFAHTEPYFAKPVSPHEATVTWWNFAVEFIRERDPWKCVVLSLMSVSIISSLHCVSHPSRTSCPKKNLDYVSSWFLHLCSATCEATAVLFEISFFSICSSSFSSFLYYSMIVYYMMLVTSSSSRVHCS